MLLVLLIACANVANLLLAVAVGRRQESALKLALGAQPGRLIREFLKVSKIICAAGAVLGYLIAAALITRYSEITMDLPGLGSYFVGLHLRLDATVLAFMLGLMLVAIAATGLPAALYAASPNLAQILSGEVVVGGTRQRVRRDVLVIAQVAVCTLVLVGLGLCERSLYNLRHSDTGFSARNLVSAGIYPRQPDTPPEKMKQLDDAVRDAVSSLPGVESVSISRDALLASDGFDDGVWSCHWHFARRRRDFDASLAVLRDQSDRVDRACGGGSPHAVPLAACCLCFGPAVGRHRSVGRRAARVDFGRTFTSRLLLV